MRTRLKLVLALLTSIAWQVQGQSWSWESSKLGVFTVGYKTISAETFGRPFTLSPLSPRVLPIHIWYPASESTGVTLNFFEFIKAEQNPQWGNMSASVVLYNRIKQFGDSAKLSQTIKQLEDITSISVRNASPAPGKFPVVLLGNGLSSDGYFYSIMAEYLASHGYVVVAFPSLPENISSGFAFSERGLLNQINDMEMVMNEIAKLSFVDMDKVSLAAWSVGGASQLLFQMKHHLAKAVVSMDAASQYSYGKDLITHSTYYDSASFKTPFLNLVGAGPTRFVVPRSTFFYDTLATIKQQFTFPALSHANFLSLQQYVAWLENPDTKIKYSYEKMCEVIRLFLDSHVLGKSDSKRKLNSLPSQIEYKP
jgi:hypothetical protein